MALLILQPNLHDPKVIPVSDLSYRKSISMWGISKLYSEADSIHKFSAFIISNIFRCLRRMIGHRLCQPDVKLNKIRTPFLDLNKNQRLKYS